MSQVPMVRGVVERYDPSASRGTVRLEDGRAALVSASALRTSNVLGLVVGQAVRVELRPGLKRASVARIEALAAPLAPDRLDGIVERYSHRTRRGTIRLVDGRAASVTERIVRTSGARDLRAGDAVTVELHPLRKRACASRVLVREAVVSSRRLKQDIEALEHHAMGHGRRFTILMVGRTGVGKSSTINTLLDADFASVGDHEPETAEIRAYDGLIGGLEVNVVDTPGFCDEAGSGNDAHYVEQMRRYVGEVDLMLFVTTVDDTRVRADEIQALQLLTASFGEALWDRAVVVLTRADLISRNRYAEHLTGRSAALRKRLHGITSNAGEVPFVPVSNEKPWTPDRRRWLGPLWIACLDRMSTAGFASFFLSTLARVETAGVVHVTQPVEEPAPVEVGAAVPSPPTSASVPTATPACAAQRAEWAAPAPAPADSSGALDDETQSRLASLVKQLACREAVGDRNGRTVSAADRVDVDRLPVRPRKSGRQDVEESFVEVLDVEPAPTVVIESETERRMEGVRIVETAFVAKESRGTIILTGDQAQVVQNISERKAPGLLREVGKALLTVGRRVKRFFGF